MTLRDGMQGSSSEIEGFYVGSVGLTGTRDASVYRHRRAVSFLRQDRRLPKDKGD